MTVNRRTTLSPLSTAMLCAAAPPLAAQSGRTLRMLVGYPPGGAAAMVDVLGGTVPALATTLPNLVQPHRQGRVRILAFTGDGRLPGLPDVPTFKELGYPDLVIEETFGVFGSARLDTGVQAELHAAIRKAAGDPRVIAALRKQEFEPLSLSQADFAARLRADHERWGPVIRATGYTVDD